MLKEEFKTWQTNPFFNATLIIVGIHVINLDYLEDGSPHLIELPDGSMDKSNKMLVELDIAGIFPETNN